MMAILIGAAALATIGYTGAAQAADVDAFTKWDPLFKKYGKLRNVPWRWLKAICMNESNLGRHPAVVAGMANPGGDDGWSDDGLSRGLMQMTPDTANRPRVRPGTSVAELDNPEISVDCAARYLNELASYYFAWDREGVIRGYNGGPGWQHASANSLKNTEVYYARFESHLTQVLEAQPGDEMERE